MKFTITGDFNTFRASVTWEDGHLEGPEDVVAAIDRRARELEGKMVMAPDADDQPYSTADHLSDPHSARELIKSQLDPGSAFDLVVHEGELPLRPGYRSRIV
jgi:LmbE family N-acetylglucosaminyl deacetylase